MYIHTLGFVSTVAIGGNARTGVASWTGLDRLELVEAVDEELNGEDEAACLSRNIRRPERRWRRTWLD